MSRNTSETDTKYSETDTNISETDTKVSETDPKYLKTYLEYPENRSEISENRSEIQTATGNHITFFIIPTILYVNKGSVTGDSRYGSGF